MSQETKSPVKKGDEIIPKRDGEMSEDAIRKGMAKLQKNKQAMADISVMIAGRRLNSAAFYDLQQQAAAEGIDPGIAYHVTAAVAEEALKPFERGELATSLTQLVAPWMAEQLRLERAREGSDAAADAQERQRRRRAKRIPVGRSLYAGWPSDADGNPQGLQRGDVITLAGPAAAVAKAADTIVVDAGDVNVLRLVPQLVGDQLTGVKGLSEVRAGAGDWAGKGYSPKGLLASLHKHIALLGDEVDLFVIENSRGLAEDHAHPVFTEAQHAAAAIKVLKTIADALGCVVVMGVCLEDDDPWADYQETHAWRQLSEYTCLVRLKQVVSDDATTIFSNYPAVGEHWTVYRQQLQ